IQNNPVLYSICYNGVYMLPETVLTVIVAAILLKIPQIGKLFAVENEPLPFATADVALGLKIAQNEKEEQENDQ
ncbi:MAG: energy-coupled thiamine transporter ThiT, partial [Clostridia bacterium]|nr:energy-coupled thiamine transporter ThiT [Clostridia bacterium]